MQNCTYLGKQKGCKDFSLFGRRSSRWVTRGKNSSKTFKTGIHIHIWWSWLTISLWNKKYRYAQLLFWWLSSVCKFDINKLFGSWLLWCQIPIDGSIGLNWRNWMVEDPHRPERAGYFQIGKSAGAKIFTRSSLYLSAKARVIQT